jgi:O-antigen ligase
VSISASLDRTKKGSLPHYATATSGEVSTWFYFLGFVIFAVGFWFPEHGWQQSKRFADIDEMLYDGTVNITADKLDGIDKSATVARISLAIFGLICFWVQRRFRLRVSSPLLWIGLAYGAIIYGSVFWSINPAHTLFKLVVLSCFGGAALGFATAFSLRQLLEWLALTCAAYLMVGLIAELALGTFEIGGNHRFVGTVHPNTEAIFGAILCLSSRLFYRTDRSKLLAVFFFALAVFCIYLTKSRTTLAAVVVAFAVMQILAARGKNRVYLILACLFALGCVAASSVLLSVRNTGQISSFIAMGRTEDVTTLTGRLPLWEELLTWIHKAPVLGYGYLAFWDGKRVEFLSETFSWEIPHGHNMYLDITLDVGLVGAALFVTLLVGALIAGARLYTRTNKVEYAIVVGIYICAIINGGGESLFKLPGLPLFALVSTFIALLHDVDEPKVEKAKINRKLTRRELGNENC